MRGLEKRGNAESSRKADRSKGSAPAHSFVGVVTARANWRDQSQAPIMVATTGVAARDRELEDVLRDPELQRLAGLLSAAPGTPAPPLHDAFRAALRRQLMGRAATCLIRSPEWNERDPRCWPESPQGWPTAHH